MTNVEVNTDVLASLAQDSPVTMVNLLRYHKVAKFNDSGQAQCSGLEAYRRYAAKAVPLVESIGASLRFAGAGAASVAAPEGEVWHDIVIVDYPSVASFIAMANSPEYQSFCYLRLAALADTRLIAFQGEASFI